MQDPWVVGKKFGTFPSNVFTQPFRYFQIVNLVDCLSSWYKFIMNNPSNIKFTNFIIWPPMNEVITVKMLQNFMWNGVLITCTKLPLLSWCWGFRSSLPDSESVATAPDRRPTFSFPDISFWWWWWLCWCCWCWWCQCRHYWWRWSFLHPPMCDRVTLFEKWDRTLSVKRNICQEHIAQALNPSPTISEILLQGRLLQPNTAVQISVFCFIPVLRSTVPGFVFWPKCTAESLMLSNDFPVSSKYNYL